MGFLTVVVVVLCCFVDCFISPEKPLWGAVKISQLADDTTIITENVESLKPHLQILDRFGNISGLKLNKKKTKAMWMGSMQDSKLKVLDFKPTKEPIKALGVNLSYNTNKGIEENF